MDTVRLPRNYPVISTSNSLLVSFSNDLLPQSSDIVLKIRCKPERTQAIEANCNIIRSLEITDCICRGLSPRTQYTVSIWTFKPGWEERSTDLSHHYTSLHIVLKQ